MPFRGLFSSGDVEASSSRKRSYAEITRSESRSQSPQHPSSKRRRTGPAATSSTSALRTHSPSTHTSTPYPEQMSRRYEGDGLDYRRPVVSTSAAIQTGPLVIIDLTEDDAPPYLTDNQQNGGESAERRERSAAATLTSLGQTRNRGPRFGRDIIGEDVAQLEVIDLVDSDETEELEPDLTLDFDEDLFGDRIDRSSPEVTFVSERPAPEADTRRVPSQNTLRRLPTPQDRRIIPNPYANLRDFISRNGNYHSMSGSDMEEAREALDRETLDRIDGIREGGALRHNRAEQGHVWVDDDNQRDRRFQPFGNFPIAAPVRPGSIGVPDYVDIEDLEIEMDLDYENTAFEVVDQDRLEIIEPPRFWPAMNARRQETPIEIVKEPYIRPKQRSKGFTMNFQEEDCLECPSCHEELAVGDEDTAKEQVWMVKTCGHVYCGECATNRAVTRRKGKVQKTESKVAPFKTCLVPECGKSVIGRTTMFQIYL